MLLFPVACVVDSVTMQAQAVAPPDMVCKDKFLIQSTVVPVGTTDEDITASMVSSCSGVGLDYHGLVADCFIWQFAKDDGRYIQENKLRVILISPPNSPVLSPINGVLKQGPTYESSSLKDPVFSKFEILTPPHTVRESFCPWDIVSANSLILSPTAQIWIYFLN